MRYSDIVFSDLDDDLGTNRKEGRYCRRVPIVLYLKVYGVHDR